MEDGGETVTSNCMRCTRAYLVWRYPFISVSTLGPLPVVIVCTNLGIRGLRARGLQRLVLFDVDQTLVSITGSNRPQLQALNIAFEQVHGIPHAFQPGNFAGGMDLHLMFEVYEKWGLNHGRLGRPPQTIRFQSGLFLIIWLDSSILRQWG